MAKLHRIDINDCIKGKFYLVKTKGDRIRKTMTGRAYFLGSRLSLDGTLTFAFRYPGKSRDKFQNILSGPSSRFRVKGR